MQRLEHLQFGTTTKNTNRLTPELDQLRQICSIIITITPPNFSITIQLVCATNRKLQL